MLACLVLSLSISPFSRTWRVSIWCASRQILTQENLQRLLCELSPDTNRIALLCVEQWAQACHRSLIANALKTLYHVEVKHLEP